MEHRHHSIAHLLPVAASMLLVVSRTDGSVTCFINETDRPDDGQFMPRSQ